MFASRLTGWQASRRHSPAIPGVRTRVAVAEPTRETASKIVGLRRALDIRLRPWAFRPGIGLLPMGFCCATSPVVAGAIRTRKWPLSRVFVDFNRQYVRSGHYGEVCEFFGPYRVGDKAPYAPTVWLPGICKTINSRKSSLSTASARAQFSQPQGFPRHRQEKLPCRDNTRVSSADFMPASKRVTAIAILKSSASPFAR